MPRIMDEQGERDVTDAEWARITADGEIKWQAFQSTLTWQPIDALDRDNGRPELLRAGEQWAFGYWGPRRPRDQDYECGDYGSYREDFDAAPRWRNAFEPYLEDPLDFEPEEFARVTDETWRLNLMAL